MAIRKGVSSQSIYYDEQKKSGNVDSIQNNNDSDISIDYQDSNVETMDFDSEHVVEGGETLTSIAEKYGLTYQDLADYNDIPDPNYIETGQVIKIPDLPEDTSSYTVKGGDNLTKIANAYGFTYQELADYNNIADPNYIEIGQVIKIPPKEENQNSNSEEKKVADEIKKLCKKITEASNKAATMLGSKAQEVAQNSNQTSEVIKNIIKEAFSKSNMSLDPTDINKIIQMLSKGNDTPEQLADEIKNFFKNANEKITNLIPVIASKIKETHQQNLNQARDIMQIIKDVLKNNNLDYEKYLDILRFAFFKSSSNTEYDLNCSIIAQPQTITIPNHGEVMYVGDVLYISYPNSDFNFKIPLAKFEVDENDKKKVKVVPLEGEDKEEYIKKAQQYVTDYINNTKNLDYDFIQTIKNSSLDKEIPILYLKNGGYSGITLNGKKVVINGNTIVSNDEKKRLTAQKILIHELGHAYDAAKGRISEREDWKEVVYKQIFNQNNSELLSIALKDAPNEWFARCIDNYYIYPERLTQIKINYGEFQTLYDYMKYILNGN